MSYEVQLQAELSRNGEPQSPPAGAPGGPKGKGGPSVRLVAAARVKAGLRHSSFSSRLHHGSGIKRLAPSLRQKGPWLVVSNMFYFPE